MGEKMTAEERAQLIWNTTVDTMCSVGSPRPIPSKGWYAAQIRSAEDVAREAAREEDVDRWQAVGDECERQHLEAFADALGLEATRECSRASSNHIENSCEECQGHLVVNLTLDEIVDAGLEKIRIHTQERSAQIVDSYYGVGSSAACAIRTRPLRETE